jgi:hypothetical protein
VQRQHWLKFAALTETPVLGSASATAASSVPGNNGSIGTVSTGGGGGLPPRRESSSGSASAMPHSVLVSGDGSQIAADGGASMLPFPAAGGASPVPSGLSSAAVRRQASVPLAVPASTNGAPSVGVVGGLGIGSGGGNGGAGGGMYSSKDSLSSSWEATPGLTYSSSDSEPATPSTPLSGNVAAIGSARAVMLAPQHHHLVSNPAVAAAAGGGSSPMVPRRLTSMTSAHDDSEYSFRLRLQPTTSGELPHHGGDSGAGGSAAAMLDSRTPGSAHSTAPSINGTVSGGIIATGRRFAVPALPERLRGLTNAAPTSVTTNGIRSTTGAAPSTQGRTVPSAQGQGPGDYYALLDRFMARALSLQTSENPLAGTPVLNFISSNMDRSNSYFAAFSASVGTNAAAALQQQMLREDSVTSARMAGDALDAISQLLTTSKYSVGLQHEMQELFQRFSRSIVPCSRIAMPLLLHSLQPVELVGCKKPALLLAPALSAAKENLERCKKLQAASAAGAEGYTKVEGSTDGTVAGAGVNSSLFYDPFAARRQRELAMKQKTSVLWSVGHICKVRAIFGNPLSVPLLLTSVFPIIEGIDHTCFPLSVQIPPQAQNFEVELSVQPLVAGTLKFVALQFIVNNAVHCINIDEVGLPKEKKS